MRKARDSLGTGDVCLDLVVRDITNLDHIPGDTYAKLPEDLISGVAIEEGAIRLADDGRVDNEGGRAGSLAKIPLKSRPGGVGMLSLTSFQKSRLSGNSSELSASSKILAVTFFRIIVSGPFITPI